MPHRKALRAYVITPEGFERSYALQNGVWVNPAGRWPSYPAYGETEASAKVALQEAYPGCTITFKKPSVYITSASLIIDGSVAAALDPRSDHRVGVFDHKPVVNGELLAEARRFKEVFWTDFHHIVAAQVWRDNWEIRVLLNRRDYDAGRTELLLVAEFKPREIEGE